MPRRLVPLAVLGLMLSLGVPTVAHAATETIVDARRDVSKDSEEMQETPAPQQRRGDIRRTTLTHSERAVSVRMKFVELERTGAWFSLDVRLRTNTGFWRQATVLGGSKGFFGQPLWRGDTLLARRHGHEVNCALTHNIDYVTNVITVRIPRSCLNAPRWVQANATYISARYGSAPVAFLDSAHVVGPRVNVWSSRIRRG